MSRMICSIVSFAFLLSSCFSTSVHAQSSVELLRLAESNQDEGVGGKEADWIYGDFVLRNQQLAAVIAAPVKGRNANMTVRGVGAGLIDLTRRETGNDQLGAYYPAGGRYLFEQPELVTIQVDGQPIGPEELKSTVKGKDIQWSCRSSSSVAKDDSSCEVTYRLSENSAGIEVTVKLMDAKGSPLDVPCYDAFRADRSFDFQTAEGHATLADEFFRQAYAVVAQGKSFTWSKDKLRRLTYKPKESEQKNGSWSISLVPGSSVLDLEQSLQKPELRSTRIQVIDPMSGVARAVVRLKPKGSEQPLGTVRCDDSGVAFVRLADGPWEASLSAIGYPETTVSFEVNQQTLHSKLELPLPARVVVHVTDDQSRPIPCKITFYGIEGTSDPNFAPDSASGAVGHCLYTPNGQAVQPIEPGHYEVYVSYGPEYDADNRKLTVRKGEAAELRARLKRSVDTKGWVSAELHSHSSPSGDNTSEQRGRVLNLLCEQLEFCPCTEHNRIDSYAPHLEALKVAHLMATCTGMELTGSDLPVNHQNAFPLHHHPHTQDGGGPQTDDHPEVQIERLAMWDNRSSKVVQGNHPDLRRIYRELDKTGESMPGLKKMLGFMDVVEVHPPAGLFAGPDANNDVGDPPNRITRWMQLINLGHRIPGVVNTDAHYNVHGSGWLRNWFESSSDDPAKIDLSEMIHSAEHGHIIMSTGPFLEVQASSQHEGQEEEGAPGDNLIADKGEVELHIRVQCPNWFDIDRVQVFVNGRAVDELNFTRATDSERFDGGTVKFDEVLRLELEADAHVIVGAIGEKTTLGPVMGPTSGKLQPVAVSNPIYIDVDGDGFTPNKDDLDVGLLGAEKPKK